MFKKLISFMCCLIPMGAGAAVVVNPEAGQNSVSTEQTSWTDAVATGSSITINATNANGILAGNGFAIVNNMYVGAASDQGSTTGDLYVLNTVGNPFTVVSSGNVSIGAMLQVMDGKTLAFKMSDTNPVAFDLTIGGNAVNEGIKLGSATQNAALSVAGVGTFTVNGSIVAYGDVDVSAAAVNVGQINANAGNLAVDATGAVTMGGLIANTDGDVDVTSGTTIVVNGAVQNNAGTMDFNAGGDISITGSLENAGGDMAVNGGDLNVQGTMKNDSVDGSLTLNVDKLVVNGGTQDSYSFVNNGDFYATVSGDTYFEYGLNLGGMGNDNAFSLDTGTLAFGNNANPDKWVSALSNHLDEFFLVVRQGNIDTTGYSTTGIWNGANSNTDANMLLAAQNVYVGDVRNDGTTLRIVAGGEMSGVLPNLMPTNGADVTNGNIEIDGQVVGGTGAKTDIIAANTLTIDGATSNAGAMVLNGNAVNVASVSNTGVGATLTVSSLTDATGLVNVGGNVTNTLGTTTIWAKDVTVGGVLQNNSGVLNLRGSDANGGAVQIGAIDVAGGVMNMNALAGSAAVNSTISVTGGALNLGDSLYNLNADGNITIAGNVGASANNATAAGDVNVAASGSTPFIMGGNAIEIGGNVTAIDSVVVRNIQFDADSIEIGGDVIAENRGHVVLGLDAGARVTADGAMSANNAGTVESWANDLVVGNISGNGKFVLHGANVTANNGNIDVDGNVYFDVDNDPVAPTNGIIVRDTNSIELNATADGADINVAAVSVGNGNTLVMNADDSVTIDGVIASVGNTEIISGGATKVTGKITSTGVVDITADLIDLADVTNVGNVVLKTTGGDITVGNIATGGTMELVSNADVIANTIEQTGGVLDIDADKLSAQYINLNGNAGAQANMNVNAVDVDGNLRVAGDVMHGGVGGMLNTDAGSVTAANLFIGGNLNAVSGVATYDIGTGINLVGDLNVADGADFVFNAGAGFDAAQLINAGTLNVNAVQGITLDKIVSNDGVMTLDSGNYGIDVGALEMNGGNIVLDGAAFDLDGEFNTGAMLYQQYAGALADMDVNIAAQSYEMTMTGINVTGINQNGKLLINTSDVNVGGDIVANDLRIVANPAGNWMNVNVSGNVSGGVDFIGLEKMTIGGNYVFDANSQINAAILPYAVSGAGLNETDINYWASVSLNDDDTLGNITNAADGQALISIGGTLTSGAVFSDDIFSSDNTGAALKQGQVGISLFDAVDQGTAIWLVHADDGVENFGLLEQIRNLDVNFCNADGSLCFNYLDSLTSNNLSDDDLPAYISVRDTDGDGNKDSLYVVFDPRFGGPVLLENMKIQPIVGREPDHTTGEYVSAGALDDLLAGQAHDKLFLKRTPIEVIPLIFAGTNMEEMANELYNRMEYYVENPDGAGLARFSRLFQVRELEQIAGEVVLNEHTSFRAFEDRMFDEFIWNRNRQLKKAWMDVDYGMFYQNIDDGKHTDGNRFSMMGGFDWRESNNLILGLTGRVSHTSSFAHDAMNLGYRPGQVVAGDVRIDVADTNVGFGGYLMRTLGEKSRLYGNVFADFHFLDVTRNQNFVDTIDGDGMAFSVISEWGLMHDILNQYIVGNLYARAGYNFGFNVKEQVAGDDYMRLKSDGYLVLTPGYSLTAQKRIYPSAWFQIRPYASIGVEYDVFGAPDTVKYKFMPAERFTEYAVELDPLWANIGGGIEMLSARGIQFGVDYRYQYNQDIQLHNIKVSGSYRF